MFAGLELENVGIDASFGAGFPKCTCKKVVIKVSPFKMCPMKNGEDARFSVPRRAFLEGMSYLDVVRER